MVTEFQAETQRDLLDRLLEYAARLNRELNGGIHVHRRIQVVVGLVNLTSRGQPLNWKWRCRAAGAAGYLFKP